jgi:hypothetical protein
MRVAGTSGSTSAGSGVAVAGKEVGCWCTAALSARPNSLADA